MSFEAILFRQLVALHLLVREHAAGGLNASATAALLLSVAQSWDLALRVGVQGLTYNDVPIEHLTTPPDGSGAFFALVLADGRTVVTGPEIVAEDGPIRLHGQKVSLPQAAIDLLEAGIALIKLDAMPCAGRA
jgi:hypothetical protein